MVLYLKRNYEPQIPDAVSLDIGEVQRCIQRLPSYRHGDDEILMLSVQPENSSCTIAFLLWRDRRLEAEARDASYWLS